MHNKGSNAFFCNEINNLAATLNSTNNKTPSKLST